MPPIARLPCSRPALLGSHLLGPTASFADLASRRQLSLGRAGGDVPEPGRRPAALPVAAPAAGAATPATPCRGAEPLCLCTDNLGVPHGGVTYGMWEPARLIEIVRAPGCSPVLAGARIEATGDLQRGSRGGMLYDSGDRAFYHYHLWAFPLLAMLELFTPGRLSARRRHRHGPALLLRARPDLGL